MGAWGRGEEGKGECEEEEEEEEEGAVREAILLSSLYWYTAQ